MPVLPSIKLYHQSKYQSREKTTKAGQAPGFTTLHTGSSMHTVCITLRFVKKEKCEIWKTGIVWVRFSNNGTKHVKITMQRRRVFCWFMVSETVDHGWLATKKKVYDWRVAECCSFYDSWKSEKVEKSKRKGWSVRRSMQGHTSLTYFFNWL